MQTQQLDDMQLELLQHIANDLQIQDMHKLIGNFKSNCSEMRDFEQIYLHTSTYTMREQAFILYLLGTQMILCDLADNFMIIPKVESNLKEVITDDKFIQVKNRPLCTSFDCPAECTNYMCNYPDCINVTIEPAKKDERDI